MGVGRNAATVLSRTSKSKSSQNFTERPHGKDRIKSKIITELADFEQEGLFHKSGIIWTVQALTKKIIRLPKAPRRCDSKQYLSFRICSKGGEVERNI
jgi:hypothetical protein